MCLRDLREHKILINVFEGQCVNHRDCNISSIIIPFYDLNSAAVERQFLTQNF